MAENTEEAQEPLEGELIPRAEGGRPRLFETPEEFDNKVNWLEHLR